MKKKHVAATKEKKLWGLLCAVLVLAGLLCWFHWENTALQLNTYAVPSSKLPDAFDGYRIAHISDLHNAQMGAKNEKLLNLLRNAQPDMIAITGDLIDCYNPKTNVALDFLEEAVKIAPCYYVTGNHEARFSQFAAFRQTAEALGVTVLADTRVTLEKNGQSILLMGVDDSAYISTDEIAVLSEKLRWLVREDDPYTLLLSHRPGAFRVYVDRGIDLVLSGHLHGGQFRLPGVGGLYTPSTGFFPEYDGGLYTEGETNMVVSRGIGNSIFPVRINNRPELILIQLQKS